MFNARVQRLTRQKWNLKNPTLANNELAMETDSNRLKIGDGKTPWVNLPFLSGEVDKLNAIPGRVLLGEFVHLNSIDPGPDTESAMEHRETQIGRTFDLHHTQFYDMDDVRWPGAIESAADAHGRGIVVSVRGYPPNQINAGTHDAKIVAAAQRAKAFGKPLLVRYAWEMNGNWFSWSPCYPGNGNDPASFVRAWRRTVDIFRSAGASNVTWFWAPNSNSSPGGANGGSDIAHWNNWRYYYPGDNYVDWVGMSAYNFGDNPLGGSRWMWIRDAVAPLLNDYKSGFGGRTSANKPFALGEWGSHATPGGRGFWFSDAAGWLVEQNVQGLLYFDTDDDDATYGWGEDPQSLAAMKEIAASPDFGGTKQNGSGYTGAVLSDNPVNYWRFSDPSGNFVDSGSARVSATVTGTPQRRVPPFKPGLGSPAIAFKGDGSSPAGAVTGHVSLPIQSLGTELGGLTFEFLFKAESSLKGGSFLFGEANTADSEWFGIGLNRGAGFSEVVGSTVFFWRDSYANTDHRAAITAPIYDGLWHHVVWVQNRTNSDVIYIDGVAVSASNANSYGNGSGMLATAFQWPPYLGARNYQNALDGACTAAVDELAIYTSPLSAARVSAHYNALMV